MTQNMTIDELRDILITCAGGDTNELPNDISDTPFDDLGYDSLVLIETAATLKRDHGIQIPDDEVTNAGTPAELLQLINNQAGN